MAMNYADNGKPMPDHNGMGGAPGSGDGHADCVPSDGTGPVAGTEQTAGNKASRQSMENRGGTY